VRILYLADIRFPLERANGIQTIETCHALAKRGHTIRLLVRPDTVQPPRDPLAFYDLPAAARLFIERAPVFGPPAARRTAYLAQALEGALSTRSRADIVMTRDLAVASLLLRVPASLRPPVVYESHGLASVFAEARPDMLTGGQPAPPRKLQRLAARERRVWRLADGYVTITGALALELGARFGPRGPLMKIADGVRLEPHRRFASRAPSADPIVMYAGHLYPWKGVDILLRALALLPDVRGLVVGGHPAEGDLARLKALALELQIGGRVSFTGYVDRREVASLLDRADVLVMPHGATLVSERYASPLKLFEYMASGRPIVASDLPAVREVVQHDVSAWLVEPNDPAALATGIRRVLDDAALGERIGRTAFDEVKAYSWDRRAEHLETLLADVAATRDRRVGRGAWSRTAS
jgi:glycosyltransferase involved in cell wall biosynthesis